MVIQIDTWIPVWCGHDMAIQGGSECKKCSETYWWGGRLGVVKYNKMKNDQSTKEDLILEAMITSFQTHSQMSRMTKYWKRTNLDNSSSLLHLPCLVLPQIDQIKLYKLAKWTLIINDTTVSFQTHSQMSIMTKYWEITNFIYLSSTLTVPFRISSTLQ